MTLQWTVVAGILYLEIAACIILLLPWIRPTLWKKLFNSRLAIWFKSWANIYSYAVVAVLLLLFMDAVREARKYSHIDISEGARHAEADALAHMRLFRAQRNLYISGFSLLLFLVCKRIVDLLARSAYLEASAEAALKQAESANKTAKTLMEAENSDEAVKKLTTQLKELAEKLRKTELDRDTMKDQAKNLQAEYDRVCELLEAAEGGNGDKKDD
uniref:Endoplasmic reticulum transmembrane protein n=1 Tax=Acrobeloides nanus TaxID=290746 RepID=A0A914E5V5_9BILA